MRGQRDTKGMFADELEAMMATMPLSKVRVADLCARCGVERRDFYRQAFAEDSQNSIQRYLLQFSTEVNEATLRRYLGVRTLLPEYAFVARHFAHGNVGCMVDWLGGAMDASPERLAECVFSCMPDVLRVAYASRAQ